ncbi:MAG: prolipoprotein diacylglyceryl transferase [Candidatus Nanopelagicaceae bacterium]
MFLSYIPTPSISKFSVGPLTFHAYALCIIAGVIAAIWIGDRRYRQFGGSAGVVSDLAIWVVPAGVIGGRLYHVITSPEYFFGSRGNLVDVVKIWEGGLGIWGAIALGGIVAYWRYQKLQSSIRNDRNNGEEVISFTYFADALAPGLLVAQGIGRFGNWFNGELFGSPTTLPWALEIPRYLRPSESVSVATYHPTFLYEAICNFALAVILIRLTNRYRSGSLFLIYVAGYCSYRFFIEGLRIDTAHTFAGLRLNQWVSLVVGLIATITWVKFAEISKFRKK